MFCIFSCIWTHKTYNSISLMCISRIFSTPKKFFFIMILICIVFRYLEMWHFFKLIFFTTHHDLISPLFYVLSWFTKSSIGYVSSIPPLVYQWRMSNTSDHTSTLNTPPLTHSLTVDSVPTVTPSSLKRNTRIHRLVDRYGSPLLSPWQRPYHLFLFPPHKQEIKHECWR